ncbi:MAG: PucC family protein, partial [Chloroflexota bacterium]
EGMANGAAWAYVSGFVLFFVFRAMIALMANTYLDLVAECTTEETRGKVLAAAWTGQTAIIVVWALVFRWLMPTYSLEGMQRLYSLTPAIVFVLGVASIWNLEKRLTPAEVKASRHQSFSPSSADAAPLKASLTLLHQPAARTFFFFVLLSFPSIFLQDSLQEVFGGEVLGMTLGETTIFQQIFNGAVTIGMGLTAAFGARALGASMATPDLPADGKKRLILIGGSGAVLSLLLQSVAALTASGWIFNLALGLFGFTVGILTFAAVTMMSDMTVEGETGRYLGLWSLAQAVGLGLSFLVGGLLHTLFIGSGLFAPAVGYALIFGLEAVCMAFCVRQSQGSSVTDLKAQAVRSEIRLGEV